MSDDNSPLNHSSKRSDAELPESSPSRSPREPSIDSHEEWQRKYKPLGSKRSRDEEDHVDGPAPTRPPLPAREFSQQANAKTAAGSQHEYVQYGNPVVYVSPQTPQITIDRFRMLLAVIPQDEALCSLHLSQPPSTGEGHRHFPTAESIAAFYAQQNLVATVHGTQSTSFGMYCVVEFNTKADAIQAFLLTGPFAHIGGAVVKVGWSTLAKAPVPPPAPFYSNPEVEACAKRFSELFEAVQMGDVPNTSNEEWAKYEEAKHRKIPTPPPVPVTQSNESIPAPPSYEQQFTAPVTSGHPPSSYLPTKAPEVPKPGPIQELIMRARADLHPQRSRVSFKEVKTARTLTEAGEAIRFNRTVLQLTTAIDPLMNYEPGPLGVHCDTPMFALPFADERAVYEATSQFGDINGIIFSPDKRSVFITFAKVQSVAAAVAKARQANWLDGGVRASALGHMVGGRLY